MADSKSMGFWQDMNNGNIKPKRSLAFNILKYLVATLPIAIPFMVLMIITNMDILVSILGTLAIDVCIIIVAAIYYVNKQNGNIYR